MAKSGYNLAASGAMGSMTLETPEEFAQWLAHGQKLDAERQVKKDAIELDRAIRFRQVPRPPRKDANGDEFSD